MPDYLAVLAGWRCPTCGNGLATRADHCGESESHLLRRTQSGAAKRLRMLYRVPVGADLDAALIAAAAIPRPAHRPPKGSHGPRQTLKARVDPEAIRRIEIARKVAGQSLGDYLSEHGLGLP